MKRLSTFLLKLFLCFLIGCKSVPMFTENTTTLLIGKVVFRSDFVSRQEISFKGITTSGIEIALKNTLSNEILRFPLDKNGLFYANLKEGKYLIDELFIRKEGRDGSWSDIYTNPSQKILEIEKGKVNNIGTIHWTYENRRHEAIQFDSSLDIRNEFLKQFPKSNWNAKEWIYNTSAFEVKQASKEKISYYVKSEDGQDSSLLTVPKNIPDELRQQVEKDMIDRMNDHRIQGDTTYYVKSKSGLDSAMIKIPKNMPNEIRQQVEKDMIDRMNNYRIQGDTIYYVKSKNGLDSAMIKIPKNMPESVRRDIEGRMRQNMK